MTKIALFCAAGMSTSMLVSKMRKAAEVKGIEVEIDAHPESQMAKHLDGLNVALLGPQVGYILPKAKKVCDEKGVPVAVIPTVDYGMMNGEKVLAFALKLAGK
ncbi:PTS sugar transporter subunit IIB [Clostridium polyendosporum]|uniref:PTS sugar transporter subunit IIB n=1 Tax=Clostridium polyendosporum TaxID=69208 RepID=A0A919VHF8_9CLOT|nr:PTS sugar transporter subunit IIB [Clostridium polyendosporum]GIM30212.1 PTS sugar transporter subunit IIB [Clostridium polyendosporum]